MGYDDQIFPKWIIQTKEIIFVIVFSFNKTERKGGNMGLFITFMQMLKNVIQIGSLYIFQTVNHPYTVTVIKVRVIL